MTLWTAVLAWLLLLPGLSVAATPAALWQVQTLPTRSLAGGTSATLALATRSPLAPQHVLLFLSPYPRAMLKVADGSTALALNVPWVNAAAELNARGVAVAFADAPSDANKRGLASMNVQGVVGAVDFSGGRTDKNGNGEAGFLNAMMVRGFAEFGQTTRVPTLWVFAENDSRYTANTIRASYQAYVEAGGQATLSLSPPIEGDGHFVHQKPDLWRPALRTYLSTLKDPSHAP